MNSSNTNNSSKKRGGHDSDTTITNFHVNYALKMSVTMIMQFYVISVKHGSTLNVTILIILITNIYKVVMNHGIAFLVPKCSFHLEI